MANTIVATTIPLTEDQRAAYKEEIRKEIRKELEGEQSWVDKFNHAMDAQKFKGSSSKSAKGGKMPADTFNYLG